MGISSSGDSKGQVKKFFGLFFLGLSTSTPTRKRTHPNLTSLSPYLRSFPFNYRYVANGHRASATARPLAWDAAPRTCTGTPEDAKR